MRRIGLKPTPQEPPIFFKESKQEPEVLLKKKNCTTLVQTDYRKIILDS
jgi:hypothetical protein